MVYFTMCLKNFYNVKNETDYYYTFSMNKFAYQNREEQENTCQKLIFEQYGVNWACKIFCI